MGSSINRSAVVCSTLAAVLVWGVRPAAGQTVPSPAPPPPPPPPAAPAWSEPPSTSLAGTQLVPLPGKSGVVTAPAASTPGGTAFVASSSEDLERRVDSLETKLDAANKLIHEYEGQLRWLKMFKLSGFIQGQMLNQWFNDAASPDVITTLPSGTGAPPSYTGTTGQLRPGVGSNDVITNPSSSSTPTTNQDYFRLRRARVRLEVDPVDFVRFVFEIDPTPAGGTVGGTGTIAREMEAIGIARWTDHIKTEFGVGIFKIPFGFEVQQYDPERPFIERSWGERNMTPGEFDTGARAYTTFYDKLTFQAAVVNGNLEGEKTFSLLPDLNQGKDLVGRLNYDFGAVNLGVSGYYGQGQLTNPTQLAFKLYPRGAGNVELGFHHTFSKVLGATKFFAEGTVATNMDRGVIYTPGIGLPLMPANPASENVAALHEVSVWGRVEQDFTRWFTLGVRVDYYNPNDSVCATESNCSSMKSARTTVGVVGALHFTKWLQYMIEYDHSVDNVHRAGSPAPSGLIDVLSNSLQARF
jgi:hypothetical protein